MTSKVTIPRPVQEVVDEVERIKAKIKQMQELGGDTSTTEGLLEEAMPAILGELATEARYEIIGLKEQAQHLNHAVRPDKPDPNARNNAIQANEDINRLEGFEAERKRIEEKIKHAKRHAEPGADTGPEDRLIEALKRMDRRIRDAARAAARKEIKDLNQDIDDLRRGKPKRDHVNGPGGKGPDTPDKPDDDDKDDDDQNNRRGGGGGGGSGSADDPDDITAGDTGVRLKPGSKTKGEAPDLATIFVRSENTVFAWDARDLQWNPMEFPEELIEARKIDGGILAFSKSKAALYDTKLGEWLPTLMTEENVLSASVAD